jgi:3-isopropylmalate dehydratase small subunit
MVQATSYKVQGSAMKFTNKINTPEVNPTNFLDTLCQGFEGGSFYGLEYVLDDFFENTKEKPPVPVLPGFDWFGLDS